MRHLTILILSLPLLIGCREYPSHPRTLLAQGISFLEREEYFMADLFLEMAVHADTLLDDAWYYRGLSLADQGESEAADSCFGRAISLNAVHRSALFMRGQVRLHLGNVAGAMVDFSEITFLYPSCPDGYRGRAWVFDRIGRVEEAIDEWGLAIRRRPNDPLLYEERGLARLEKADADSAVIDFSTALSIEPSLPRSYAGRGEARYLLGLFTLAMADCDSALVFDSKDADAWLTRGRSADDSGEFDVAVASYREFLRLVPETDPDVPGVRMRLRRLGKP